jgi:hypothetical protein
MKKYFKFAAFAMAIALATPTLVSCGDDNDDNPVVIDVPQATYSVNRIGGLIDVELNTSGDWTAEILEEKGVKAFADVVNKSGTGKAKIQVAVDYFSPRLQKEERTAQLVITCGDLKKVVTIRQYVGLKDGDTVGNADNNTFFDLWADKGLGAGYDVENAQDATDKILNIYNLSKMDRDIQEEVMRQERPMSTDLKDIEIDTLFKDTVSLTVDAKLDVSYLKFKLGLEVNYDNKGLQIVDSRTYNCSQSLIHLRANLSVSTLREIITSKNARDGEIAKKLFTRGFRGVHERICKAADANDDATFKAEVESMLATFGPAMVAASELGGNMFVSVKYDSTMLANNFNVKGKASAEMTFGPLNIKGGVSVGYGRNGEDIYQSSQHSINVSGGDKEAIADFTAVIATKVPDPAQVSAAAQKWAKSIISSDDEKDNTRVVRINPVGIWNLFPTKHQQKIKAVAVEYYKGKKTCINIASLK